MLIPSRLATFLGGSVAGQYYDDDHSIALNDDRTAGVPVHEYAHASGLDTEILKIFEAK
jgi:hypothetical protein